MKRRKIVGLLSFVLVITFIAAACSKKASYNETADMSTATYGNAMNGGSTTSAKFDKAAAASDYTMSEAGTEPETAVMEDKDSADVYNTSEVSSGNLQAESQNKIIQRYYLAIETKDFDNLVTDIENQINSLGGYVESSQIGGKSYLSSSQIRNGNVIARIPSEKAEDFINNIKNKANVTDNQKNTENVSIQYIDAQSRIKTLKIEQERLFAILEKTEKLESIITLESRLSDIRYELQNYESQIRMYDNQVEYSTITMNIQEVERITPVKETKQSFGSKIKNGFSDTIYHISEGFKNFAIWLIINFPYFLIWGVIILIVVLIARRYIKKMNSKKLESTQAMDPWQRNQDRNPVQENHIQENQEQENQVHENQEK